MSILALMGVVKATAVTWCAKIGAALTAQSCRHNRVKRSDTLETRLHRVSDIFLSYARQDRDRVQPLVVALQKRGWSVWWDPTILPGKNWDHVIQAELNAARCVIVTWSRESVHRDWVLIEAGEGKRRGILIPALIDDVTIPLAFTRIQSATLGIVLCAVDRGSASAFRTVHGAIPPASRPAVPLGFAVPGTYLSTCHSDNTHQYAGIDSNIAAPRRSDRRYARLRPRSEAGTLPRQVHCVREGQHQHNCRAHCCSLATARSHPSRAEGLEACT